MAGTTSKSISLTDLATGTVFKLQASAVINFFAINAGADSNITYVDPATGMVVIRDVAEAVATINTAAGKTFAVTTLDGVTLYIHADRVIFIADLTTHRQISYFNENGTVLQQILVSTSAAAINTAAGNTFTVTMSADGTARFINCNQIMNISSVSAERQAILAVLLKAESAAIVAPGTGYVVGEIITQAGGTSSIKSKFAVATLRLASVAINAAGTGYNIADTVTLAGGTSTSKAIITVATVGGSGEILTFTITNAGNYTVGATSFTQDSTSGIGTGATFNLGVFGARTLTVNTAGSYSATPTNPASQESSTGSGVGATFTTLYEVAAVTVVEGGVGYGIAPTITISGDGSLATATATIVNGSVNQVTVTAAGGSYTSATAAASGGGGTLIKYDAKNATPDDLHVTQTAAALQTTINAL